MPQNETEATLLVQYDNTASEPYSYSQLSLLSVLPDASQIEVRWDVDTVYNQSGSVAYSVEDLSDDAQATIKTLIQGTHYTIFPDSDTIEIDEAAIEGSSVTVDSGQTYYYPSTFTLSTSQNLQIRRATDITNQVVTFQPGSRLTSNNLNLANGQLFNALQELTVFGISSGGIVSGIDLSNSEIQELSNVNLPATPTGILSWDGSTVEVGTATGDFLPELPTSNFPTDFTGQVATISWNASSYDTDWNWLTFEDVKEDSTGATSLQSSLNGLSTRIGDVEGDTQDLSAPSTGNSSFSGNLTVSGDLTVTGDIIRSAPYFIQMNLADTTSDITGGGTRDAGNVNDFPSQSINGTGVADLDTSTGIWTAPRDMTIEATFAGHITTDDPSPADGEVDLLVRGLITINKNGASQGTQALLYRRIGFDFPQPVVYGRQSTIFTVSANDVVTLEFSRAGSSTASVGLENAQASLKELR
jgi:hypothetical protein